VIVEKCNSVSPKTICAWWRAISYVSWPCYREHSRSRCVNLEKQSPIIRCECRVYGMNGSGLVCLKQHPLSYQAISQRWHSPRLVTRSSRRGSHYGLPR
jgi:hypothetical protein